MAKVQTRRTISLNRDRFRAATDFARGQGVSLSTLTEYALEQIQSGVGLSGLAAWAEARSAEVAEHNYRQMISVRSESPSRLAAKLWMTGTCTQSVAARQYGVSTAAVSIAAAAIRRNDGVIRPAESKSRSAARFWLNSGCTQAEAAKRFGVTQGSVSIAARYLR